MTAVIISMPQFPVILTIIKTWPRISTGRRKPLNQCSRFSARVRVSERRRQQRCGLNRPQSVNWTPPEGSALEWMSTEAVGEEELIAMADKDSIFSGQFSQLRLRGESSYVGDGGRAVADFVIFARKVDAPRSRSLLPPPPPPPPVLPHRRLRLEFSPPVRFRLHFDSSQRGLPSLLPSLSPFSRRWGRTFCFVTVILRQRGDVRKIEQDERKRKRERFLGKSHFGSMTGGRKRVLKKPPVVLRSLTCKWKNRESTFTTNMGRGVGGRSWEPPAN